jgi:hypothetical protein
MDRLIDEYEEKHQQSIIVSKTGVGLVIGAILLSFIDAAYIPPPETEETPSLFGMETLDHQIINLHAQNGEITLGLSRKF